MNSQGFRQRFKFIVKSENMFTVRQGTNTAPLLARIVSSPFCECKGTNTAPLLARIVSSPFCECIGNYGFYYIIGIVVLSLLISLPTVSQENIRIPQKQIRARVVSANGTPLANAHIRVRVLHKDLDGSGWGSSPDTKQTDAKGFFVADLRVDEPHIYFLGVEYRGYLAKVDPFIIDEEKPQVPLLLTLNGDPTQDAGRTSDQAYAALERFLHTPAVWVVNPTNGHAYKRIYCEDITDAIAQAAVEKAYVIALNDKAEDDWIRDAFLQHGLFWIGLSDVAEEGKWTWHSGEPVEYINWEEKYHTAEGGNTELKDYAIVGFTGRWEAVGVDSDGETYTAFLEKGDLPIKNNVCYRDGDECSGNAPVADPIC